MFKSRKEKPCENTGTHGAVVKQDAEATTPLPPPHPWMLGDLQR